jgi:hypothetical protein
MFWSLAGRVDVGAGDTFEEVTGWRALAAAAVVRTGEHSGCRRFARRA